MWIEHMPPYVRQTMEGAMGQVTTLGTPQDQVESLIRQVAEEHDLEITDQLFGLQKPVREDTSASVKEGDDLTRRFVARVILAVSCLLGTRYGVKCI